jgi:hypothetical protein
VARPGRQGHAVARSGEAIISGELGTMNGADDVVAAWYAGISDGQDIR